LEAEGGSVVFFGFGVVAVEVGEALFYGFGHVKWAEVVEIVGVGGAYLGEGGEAGAEDGATPLHGFDDGEPEPFGEGREEECGAVGVEPAAMVVGDGAEHGDIGVLRQLLA
jgi:hypothetical protein